MTKEHPIIFSGPMVRAYLDGRKTQTRRPIKPQPEEVAAAYQAQDGSWIFWYPDSPGLSERTKKLYKTGGFNCPHGQPGDRLWVREALIPKLRRLSRRRVDLIHYKADGEEVLNGGVWPWETRCLTGRFMPRWASRTILDVTNIRVERVQDITEEDAIAEGVEYLYPDSEATYKDYLLRTLNGCETARESYMTLWDSLYRRKPEFQWQVNPWVWVIEFSRCQD